MDPTQRLQLANDHIQDFQREAAIDRLLGGQHDRPKPPRGPMGLVARVGAAIAGAIPVTRHA